MSLFQPFLQRYSNICLENKILKVAFSILLITTVINSYGLYQLSNTQRTIIIPAGLGCEFEIMGNSANSVYLRQMARYILDLRSNISASTVRTKFEELLTLVPPQYQGAMREKLMLLANDFERHRCISQYITIDEQTPITLINHQKMTIKAIKYRIAGKEVVRKNLVIYHIDFSIKNGRFHLTSLSEDEKVSNAS